MRRFLLLVIVFALLAGCGGDGDDLTTELSGREFVSDSIRGKQLVAGTEIRLRFSEHSELSASAGCNTMFGPFAIDGDVLRMSGLATTEIGCDAPRHAQDAWIQDLLTASPRIALEDPRLVLSTEAIRLTLVDRELASPDRPLVGTRWIGNGMGDEQAVSIGPGSASVTVAFDADDQVSVFTGCQHGSGTFSVDAATIGFDALSYDGAACTQLFQQSVSDQVLFVLDGSDVSYKIEEKNLTIKRDGRSLMFLAQE